MVVEDDWPAEPPFIVSFMSPGQARAMLPRVLEGKPVMTCICTGVDADGLELIMVESADEADA